MWSHGVMVSTQDSESCNPSSNLGGTFFYFCFQMSLSRLLSVDFEVFGRVQGRNLDRR